MDLAADIHKLRDEVLQELTSVHDYYTNTVHAWRIVRTYVEQSGRSITIRNLETGTETSGQELATSAQSYVTEYLASATFQQFVSLFEDFVFGLMRLWLLAHPYGLNEIQIAGAVVLSAPDLESVKLELVDSKLNKLKYKKPHEWFDALNGMVKLGCPAADEIDRLAEMKASRDMLVHNRGVANDVYERKAGSKKRCRAGQKLEIPEPYHRESWKLVRKTVDGLAESATKKARSS